ncbi:MAG: hypothetical protein ACE5K0_09385 [Candidatus Methanofastidiosia archaeon]
MLAEILGCKEREFKLKVFVPYFPRNSEGSIDAFLILERNDRRWKRIAND